jgi:hypothetical protein
MKGLGALVVLGLMGLAPVAMSQNVFTGTWRPDPHHCELSLHQSDRLARR